MGTGKVLEQLQGLSGARCGRRFLQHGEEPLEAAFPDGIQVVDGAVAYSSGNGVPFYRMGPGIDRDRYYFKTMRL